MSRSSQTRASRDIFNCSEQELTDFPTIPKPNTIATLIASNNFLTRLPEMRSFSILRSLNLSNNQLTDVSSVGSIRTLLELDISGNQLTSLSFSANLTNLEILRASSNDISSITTPFPDSLAILTLADNHLSDLDFMENCLPHARLAALDVSGNEVSALISLRFLPLYENLRDLKVGIADRIRSVPAVQFVKFLCPTLESFDDELLGDVDGEFPEDELIEHLRSGTEKSLRDFLIGAVKQAIQWNEPEFVDFQEDMSAPLEALEGRVRVIEERIPHKKGESEEIGELRADVRELKAQVAQIARLLFVHDRALGQIWEGGAPGKDGDSF